MRRYVEYAKPRISWGTKSAREACVLARQSNAVDFWRGFALITIFINHVPGIYFERFTYKNLSISDSADLFVFLAGWALRLVAGPPENPTPTLTLMARVGRRSLTIYAAHILIMSIAIAMLAAAARALDNPLLLEWNNAAAVFYDPVNTHIGLVLLTHQLGYFDILPLYVVLMLVAPLIVLIHRQAPNWLFALSLTIYLATLIFRIQIQSWPGEGQWFFNPLAWQFVFVLGFQMARVRGVGGFVRCHIFWIRLVALPIILVAAVAVAVGFWPDATKVPEPKLLFLLSKTYATPIRLIQFLALVAVFSAVYPYLQKWMRPLVDFFSRLGRNSLNVFCVGSVLSLAGQILRFVFRGSVSVDILIAVVGIGLLFATAWLSEWQLPSKGSS